MKSPPELAVIPPEAGEAEAVKAAGLNLRAMAIKISRKIATAKLLMQNM